MPALLAAFVLASALGASAASAATGAPSPSATPAVAGPTDIAIPYLGDTKITPATPWTIADCAGPTGASPLVVGCDPSQISLAAPAFDPAAGTTVLPVTLTDGRRTLALEYRVTLAAPEAPTLAAAAGARPVSAGALLRIPVSDLGVRCRLCATGGTLRVNGVDPETAGTAWATPTHVVFRASASFRGDAEVQVWFGDDVGTESAAAVPVRVYAPSAAPLVAMDVFVPLAADGTATLDLSTLIVSAGGSEPVLISCGSALVGTVSCDGAGAAVYRGPGGTDQFGFQYGAGGERAFGSVTLLPPDAAAAEGLRPVPTAPGPDATVATIFAPPQPVEGTSTTESVFAGLIGMLDRVGAR